MQKIYNQIGNASKTILKKEGGQEKKQVARKVSASKMGLAISSFTTEMFQRKKSEVKLSIEEKDVIKKSNRVIRDINNEKKGGKRIKIDISDMISSFSQSPYTPGLQKTVVGKVPAI